MEQLDQTLAAIAAADTPDAVETLRVAALGKQGWVSALLKTLGGMTPDQRQVVPVDQHRAAGIAQHRLDRVRAAALDGAGVVVVATVAEVHPEHIDPELRQLTDLRGLAAGTAHSALSLRA